jgi:hypothetical protein
MPLEIMPADGRHDKSLRFEISTKLSDLCHIKTDGKADHGTKFMQV